MSHHSALVLICRLSRHRALLPVMSPVAPPCAAARRVACHAAMCYCLSYCLSRCCVLLLEGVFNKRHSEATTNAGLKYRCTWCNAPTGVKGQTLAKRVRLLGKSTESYGRPEVTRCR